MRKVLPCLLGAAKVAAKPPGPMDFIVAKAVSLRVLHACIRDNLITRGQETTNRDLRAVNKNHCSTACCASVNSGSGGGHTVSHKLKDSESQLCMSAAGITRLISATAQCP